MDRLLAVWHRLDGRFERVQQHPWGAVVTDSRYPVIWDVNYARVESEDPHLGLAEVRAALDPALERVDAVHRHIVVFRPERLTSLVAQASSAGARLTWDLVMLLEAPPADPRPTGIDVRETRRVDDAFLDVVRRTLVEFDVSDPQAVEQLVRIEREVMLPAGKRWFHVGPRGEEAALGSLVVMGGVGLVDHVVTMPFARRRGYAHAVVRRIVTEAFTGGARSVVLLTEPHGAARRIYRRLGFEPLTTIAAAVERR